MENPNDNDHDVSKCFSDMMMNLLKPRSVVQLLQPASRLLGLRPLASSSQSPHLLHNIQPSLGPKLCPEPGLPQQLLSLQNTRAYEKDATLALVDLNSLELYRESFSSAAIEDTILDKCVNIIKRENIQVRGISVEASLKDWVSDLWREKKNRKAFPGLKVGAMTFKDKERIQEKAEELRLSLGVEKDTFYEELIVDADENCTLKEKIVGHYLSRNLKEPRHPTEVFFQLKKLVAVNKGEYTEEEDRMIMKVVEEHGETPAAWRMLSQSLRRTYISVQGRYKVYLKHKDKTTKGKLSTDENIQMLKFIFDKCPDAMETAVTYDVFKELATIMNRPPVILSKRWHRTLHPLLTRHEAGVLAVDFRLVLLRHCVENNIEYAQDGDWGEIAKLPQFHGTTPAYLAEIYRRVRGDYKQTTEKLTNQTIAQVDITSEVLLEYLQTRGQKQRISKELESVLSVYETIK